MKSLRLATLLTATALAVPMATMAQDEAKTILSTILRR